jgi:hypothetical protein
MEIIIPLKYLQLKHVLKRPDRYLSLIDDLVGLPCPDKLLIGLKEYHIPSNLDELTDTICYGQRLYLAEKQTTDLGTILHVITGYYYTLTGHSWNRDKAKVNFNKCLAIDLFPAGLRILSLMGDLVEREQKLLNRKIKPEEAQAGIERLNKFAELSAIDYLRTSKNLKTDDEVMNLSYAECLVRFLQEKEIQEYRERLQEINGSKKPKK